MASLTSHLGADGATYCYLRCPLCTPACAPLAGISEDEAYDAWAVYERDVHGREPRRSRGAAETLLDAFIVSRRAGDRTEGTIRYYEAALRPFFRSLAKPLRSLLRGDVEAWIVAHPGWTERSKGKFLTSLCTFIGWAREEHYDVPRSRC